VVAEELSWFKLPLAIGILTFVGAVLFRRPATYTSSRSPSGCPPGSPHKLSSRVVVVLFILKHPGFRRERFHWVAAVWSTAGWAAQ
jgi:hypothetical protein